MGIRRTSRRTRLARIRGRLTAHLNPIARLTGEQRRRFFAIQVAASRPAYGGVLLSGCLLLVLLALLQALGLNAGIGYAPWFTITGAVILGACALIGLHVRNLPLFISCVFIYSLGLAALLSFPTGDVSSALSFRTDMFNLVVISALSLTVRRSVTGLIIVIALAIAWFRISWYGTPASGAAMYWLVIGTSIVFGMLLRGFRVSFGVQSFLASVELQAQASTDTLTGLLNRNGWERDTAKLLEQMGPDAGLACVVFFDADHFKRVNDTYGHAAGDAVLRQLATAIGDGLPADSVAARLGGEEFAVLLVGCDAAGAAAFAERVREAFATAARNRGVRVSAGVARQRTGETLSQLMRRADECLYEAKAAGRDRVVVAGN